VSITIACYSLLVVYSGEHCVCKGHCNVQREAEKILPPFHSQQHKKNATVLQVTVNNVWMLVVDILNI